MKKLHNFSAGPSILPREVFQEASQGVLDLDGNGLSILEISHRSQEFMAIQAEAKSLVRELLAVPAEFAILFLTGGASTQFFMAPMNLLSSSSTAAYLDTGAWSSKAIKEVANFGNHMVVASSKDKNYTYIPKQYDVPSDARYLHITTNNTIFGTQLHRMPDVPVPLVADMSSDIMSRKIDMSKFGLVYAGAQKNLGPAGVTIVLVRKDLLGRTERSIPTMLDYQTHIAKDSAFNTPPVFPIYTTMLNLRWLKAQGGLEVIAKRNLAKAKVLYDEIDRNDLFQGVTAAEDRSLMNVTFQLKDQALAERFISRCTEAGCVGVKGHRSVGGFRASIYNAMPQTSVEALVSVMQDFERAAS